MQYEHGHTFPLDLNIYTLNFPITRILSETRLPSFSFTVAAKMD
jgi:hypothetical protein